MNDMQRIMYTSPPTPAATLAALSASNLGYAAPTARPSATMPKVMQKSVSVDSHIISGMTCK